MKKALIVKLAATAFAASALAGCGNLPSTRPLMSDAPQGTLAVNAAPTGRYIAKVPFYHRVYNIDKSYRDEVDPDPRRQFRYITDNGSVTPTKIYDCWIEGIPAQGPLLFDRTTGAPVGRANMGSTMQPWACPGFGYNYEGQEYAGQLRPN